MSIAREQARQTKNYIDNKVDNLKAVGEAIITGFYKKSKKVVVKLLPENIEKTVEFALPFYSSGAEIGGMPKVGTRVLLAFSNPSDVNQAAYVIGFIKDDNNDNEEADETEDLNSYKISPYDGGEVNFDKDKLEIKATKDYIKTVKNDETKTIEKNSTETVKGMKEVKSDDIKLGNGSVKNLVNEDHLTNFNALADAIETQVIDLLKTVVIMGDFGIPIPLVARSAGTYDAIMAAYKIAKPTTITDKSNKTSKTKAS